MNNKLLYTYAIAKTLYEKFGDYIDTFYAFVLKVLPEDRTPVDFSYIQKNIEQNSGMFIPEFSLTSIITRAKRKGYLIEQAGYVKLTDKGDKYVQNLESEGDVNRRVNELLEDIKLYLNEPHLKIEEVYKIILCFINENIDPIIDFFNPTKSCNLGKGIKIHKYEGKLLEYFKIADQSKPNLYKTLQDIVYGSIISLSASFSNIAEINQKFRDVQIFLDSNFLFSLFELHYPEMDKPVKELFEMLKNNKFTIKVFDFTIQEIVHVLSNYANEQYMYIQGIKVNSIYCNLKSKGWTKEDAYEFIQKIEEKIWNLGIHIYPAKIDIDTYVPNRDYVSKIQKYKPLLPYQSEQTYYHDLGAIEKIKEIRGSPKREIEKSVAIFLTSDLKLSRFDFLELKHKQNLTVCEVIPDRLLTNILWLKNPSMIKDVPLQKIIAIHSRGVFIDQKIWSRFYFNVKKLRDENHITDRDVAMLFYSGHIEKALLEFNDTDVEKITTGFIEEQIDDARKKIDKETQEKIESHKVIFEEKIAGEIDKQRVWESKIKKIKSKIEGESKDKAVFVTNFEFVILLILILIFLKIILSLPKGITSIVQAAISICTFLGFKFDMFHIRSKSIDMRFNLYYQKKLKEFNLGD